MGVIQRFYGLFPIGLPIRGVERQHRRTVVFLHDHYRQPPYISRCRAPRRIAIYWDDVESGQTGTVILFWVSA